MISKTSRLSCEGYQPRYARNTHLQMTRFFSSSPEVPHKVSGQVEMWHATVKRVRARTRWKMKGTSFEETRASEPQHSIAQTIVVTYPDTNHSPI